jgi:hypothetical protein
MIKYKKYSNSSWVHKGAKISITRNNCSIISFIYDRPLNAEEMAKFTTHPHPPISFHAIVVW